MRFTFIASFVVLFGSVAACSGSGDSAGSSSGGIDGEDGGPNGPNGGGGGPDAQADGGPNAPDGSTPKPPAEPGVAYIKSNGFGGQAAYFYEPGAAKSIELAATSGRFLRPLRGGRAFAFVRAVDNVPAVFRGFAGKNGVAKEAFKMAPKSATSPQPSAGVDDTGALTYSGEIAERGFVDFFREGTRISQGAGRAPVTNGRSKFLYLVDGVAGATAWSMDTSIDAKLLVAWPGQAEEVLESDYVDPYRGEATFSPSGRCFAFRARITAPTAIKGLGVRCKGEPTRVPVTQDGIPIDNAGPDVLWHPTIDRLAAIDAVSNNTSYLYVATKNGAAWSSTRVNLPAATPYPIAFAASPDGATLWVVASKYRGISAANALFAVTFGGATPSADARPIALGTDVIVEIAGASGADGRLLVTRRPVNTANGNNTTDIMLVAPGGATQTVHTRQGFVDSPKLSPDGKTVAFQAVTPGLGPFSAEVNDLYLVDVAGGAPRKLNAQGQLVRRTKWSDTNDHIAFVADEGTNATNDLWFAGRAVGAPAPTKIDTGVTEILTDPPPPPF